MLNYWESARKSRRLFVYSFAPFMEEVSSILLGAERLWHPWSVRRKEELKTLAHSLRERAGNMRSNGLGWASSTTEFGKNPAYLLSGMAFYRYHREKSVDPNSDVVQYLISAATQLLLLLIPKLQELEKSSYEEVGRVHKMYEIIESLMEFPCSTARPNISPEALRIIGDRSLLLECEGLAYMQAILEDRYARENPGYRKHKKSDFHDKDIERLALKLGIHPKILKATFETEFSSWWTKSQRYAQSAKEKQDLFLGMLFTEKDIQDSVRSAWNPGMTSYNNPLELEYIDLSTLEKSECIIRTLISIFLSFDNKEQKSIHKPSIELALNT